MEPGSKRAEISIRPLDRQDLPEIVGLYETVFRSGSSDPPPALLPYFERTLLDHPWYDPELPSLVCEDRTGLMLAFIGVYARRLVFDGRPVRLSCSGLFMSSEEGARRAAGVFLLREYLSGPQDLSITDGAAPASRLIWERAGGQTAHLSSVVWHRVFRPWRASTEVLLRSNVWHPVRRLARPLASGLDVGTRAATLKRFKVEPSELQTQELTTPALLEHLPDFTKNLRVHPRYDSAFLDWLFATMAESEAWGKLIKNLVYRPDGSVIGWYIYYLKRGGISEVIQVVSTPRDADAVVVNLFAHAERNGAAVLRGRVEALVLEAVTRHRATLTFGGGALIHSRNQDLLGALMTGKGLLTRADGEYWMSHHVEPFDRPAST